MEIEYTIPLELNKLKEKTTDVDKIYKILDEFNEKQTIFISYKK